MKRRSSREKEIKLTDMREVSFIFDGRRRSGESIEGYDAFYINFFFREEKLTQLPFVDIILNDL